jgi:diamine N-acetyltransferase
MELIIKYASAKDAEQIAMLSRKAFYDTFAPFNTEEDMEKFMGGPFDTQVLINEVSDAANIFIGAYMDNVLVGYAKLCGSKNPPELGDVLAMEIVRIYAAQHIIGRGVGRALMQEALRIAADAGKQLVWLGVWEKNQRAIDFYTRFGFEKFGEHDFVLGDDVQLDWLMKKEL